MAVAEHLVTMRRRIELEGKRYLIYDYGNGKWRAVYYRPRFKGEVGAEPSAPTWTALCTAGMLPLVERTRYCRFTGVSSSLKDALSNALHVGGDQRYCAEVIAYLNTTDWGKAALKR